ncbi:MAG: glycoside hydrolase family 66 protein [Bacteroidales bacterium]|nr:glycoside hydrolase family 66 protein [Bacteroidales bacterium]MCK4637873.1 glycoside hydrolase family 66 protein [Bacteroidales bacterium]
MKQIIYLLCILLMFISCRKEDDINPLIYLGSEISTDKSRYLPGEEVYISLSLKRSFSGEVEVKYKYLTEVIDEEIFIVNANNLNFQWQPPSDDFKAYMVEFRFLENEEPVFFASTAVDVSSDWTKFPRYGFLSVFSSDISASEIESNLDYLKRFHINGLQFYDWHNKHHFPLKMDGNSPASSWQDIAGRDISFNTVNNYIREAKARNIASMSYNLLYGAWGDFASDGVSEEWMIFDDANHQNINKHDLDDNWASDIYLLNPANSDWQNYIFQKTGQIYEHLDFSGWHLDQLGDRGSVYNYNGNLVSLKTTFTPFLINLKTTFPDKNMVMNAVNGYGQPEILEAPVNFAYTEVWEPNNTYNHFAEIINENYNLSNNYLSTVLAAYVNYNLADNTGEFNEAAVLMADAVIMSFGGAHLELGEHMLGKEYFPNNNLSLTYSLTKQLVEYYDILVGYQNLLRDGGELSFNTGITSNEVGINDWPAIHGNIASFKKSVNNIEVYHLLNFAGINSLEWRDNDGTLTAPDEFLNFTINVPETHVTKVVYVSPDWHDGIQEELEFEISDGVCEFKIPYLKYWGMIIIV